MGRYDSPGQIFGLFAGAALVAVGVIFVLVPSMSFYPDFIQILSRFYPDFIQILTKFYLDLVGIDYQPQTITSRPSSSFSSKHFIWFKIVLYKHIVS